jgi:hypothetical protein
MGVPRTFPAATLALNLAMKAEREGGQALGIATPLAPTPEPVLMLKIGTREGSIAVLAARESTVVGIAETARERRDMMVVVAGRKCIFE